MMDFMHQLMATPFEFFKNYGGPFLIVLSVLVFVHEWGHYAVARLCGVRVETFSIGFGKELFGRTDKKGTRWKFCLIPLGGYVQMFGDLDPASARHAEGVQDAKTEEEIRPFTDEEKKVAFYTQSVAKRAAIVVAGPAVNYIFAILILGSLYLIQGQPYAPPVAGSVLENSAAERAGIQPDDKILSVDGVTITRFQELRQYVMVNLDKELEMEVAGYLGNNQWSDKSHIVNVKPELIEEEDRFGFKHKTGRLGIASPMNAFEIEEHTFVSAFSSATAETFKMSVDTLKSIGQIITGVRGFDELGGILRIGAYAGDFAQQGFASFLLFAALLSVNLGLINLLPIPMLDGGHLTMYAMETMRGKPLSDNVQECALKVGLVFLLGIMIMATWNDLVQLKVVDYVVSLVS